MKSLLEGFKQYLKRPYIKDVSRATLIFESFSRTKSYVKTAKELGISKQAVHDMVLKFKNPNRKGSMSG